MNKEDLKEILKLEHNTQVSYIFGSLSASLVSGFFMIQSAIDLIPSVRIMLGVGFLAFLISYFVSSKSKEKKKNKLIELMNDTSRLTPSKIKYYLSLKENVEYEKDNDEDEGWFKSNFTAERFVKSVKFSFVIGFAICAGIVYNNALKSTNPALSVILIFLALTFLLWIAGGKMVNLL